MINWRRRKAVFQSVTHNVILIPFSIREQCGHSLKSALTHTLIHDMRDESLMPSTGHFVRVFHEYAGLGGDVSHVRQEIEAQVARSNYYGYVRAINNYTFL